jgi:thymidine kinase
MSKLDIIFGPMFAGKSCEIIRRVRLLKVCNKNYLIIKPNIDTRYSQDEIVSHNFDKEKCVSLNFVSEIFDKLNNIDKINNIDTIFIDEAQFFKNLKDDVLKIVEEYKCNVIITGLDGDSNRNKFGEILDLIPYSDTCKKINALCKICKDGTPGIFSFRKPNKNNDQVHIGADIEYMAVCRKHYKNYLDLDLN